jgi:hypothetical protein
VLLQASFSFIRSAKRETKNSPLLFRHQWRINAAAAPCAAALDLDQNNFEKIAAFEST